MANSLSQELSSHKHQTRLKGLANANTPAYSVVKLMTTQKRFTTIFHLARFSKTHLIIFIFNQPFLEVRP
jgi:hypothetical protein